MSFLPYPSIFISKHLKLLLLLRRKLSDWIRGRSPSDDSDVVYMFISAKLHFELSNHYTSVDKPVHALK